jgi:hypothetical protein
MLIMRLQISDGRFQIGETGDRVVRDQGGDLLRRLRTVGSEPVRSPVQRAEEGACGDGGVDRVQRAGAHAAGDQGADAALVSVALGDDTQSEVPGQGVDLEMRRRSFDLVDETEDMSGGHLAQAIGQRAAIPARRGERFEQPIGGAVLTEEQQLVLAAEVVIEVAGGQIGGRGDVAHAGVGEAAGAEDARRRAHDRHAASVGSK